MNFKSSRPFDTSAGGGHSGTCVYIFKSTLALCSRTAIQNFLYSHNQRWPSMSAEGGACPPKVELVRRRRMNLNRATAIFKFVSKPRLGCSARNLYRSPDFNPYKHVST